MIFRQLFDPTSSTYTYLLGDSGEAVLIDPVYEQVPRDLALLRELDLRLLASLDTHVHADHVTGAWRLHQRVGSSIAVAEAAGAALADRPLRHGDRIAFGTRHLTVRATPGHTNGCLTYVLDDESMAFTGDSLLIRGCGRTDFQGGSPQQLFASVREQILTLPDSCLLYPAHDYRGITVTSVAEERRFNPRLGGDVDEGDFAGHMNNLNLPHPKLMAVAVPANLRCGQPEGAGAEGDPSTADTPAWAPLTLRFTACGKSNRWRCWSMPTRCRSWTCAKPLNSSTSSATCPVPAWCPCPSSRTGWTTSTGSVPSWRCAAPACARPRPACCWPRPASSRSPTWPAACCAGRPKHCLSRKTLSNRKFDV